jgi:hypothetical protein
LSVKLTRDGKTVSGENVTLQWQVKGTDVWRNFPVAVDATNVSGLAEVALKNAEIAGGGHRTLRVRAFYADALSADVEVIFGAPLPSGFIALSDSVKNWRDAKSYCADQGGKLPKINYSDSTGDVNPGDSIEGFGSHGGSWPADIPRDVFWSGTEFSGAPGASWAITENGGVEAVNGGTGDSFGWMSACVP